MILYNTDHRIMQYCDGADWIAMGEGPQSGSGCPKAIGPDGVEGEILYNIDHRVMQYCNGAEWVAMGPVGEAVPGVVTVDSTSTGQCHDDGPACAAGGTQLTYQHTAGSGDNRLLIVGVATGKGCSGGDVSAIASVTYNGVALTQIGTHLNVNSGCPSDGRLEQWILAGPSEGTHDVVVTAADNTLASMISLATSFFGVDQAAPIRGYDVDDGEGTPASVTVASADGDLVYDTICTGGGINAADAGQSELDILNIDSTTACNNIGASTKTGAASVDMSWSVNNDIWIDFATSIKAAPAADEPQFASRFVSSDLADGDHFGFCTAMYGDLALVGADNKDTIGNGNGKAYLFDISDPANPVQLASLTPSDEGPDWELFGGDAAISGTLALIGST